MQRLLSAIFVIAALMLFVMPPPTLSAATPTGIATIGQKTFVSMATTTAVINSQQLQSVTTAGIMTANYAENMALHLTAASPEHASGSLDRSTGFVKSTAHYFDSMVVTTRANGRPNGGRSRSTTALYRVRYSHIGEQR